MNPNSLFQNDVYIQFVEGHENETDTNEYEDGCEVSFFIRIGKHENDDTDRSAKE